MPSEPSLPTATTAGEIAPDRSLWTLIDARARTTPDALFAVDAHGARLNFAEYRDACERVAAGLAAQGIGADDRVAWMLPTRFDACIVAGALARLGAVQIPIIPILRDREVAFILRQTEARLFLVAGTWKGYDYAALASRVCADNDLSCEVVVTDDGLPHGDTGVLAPHREPDAQTMRWIFYTSGTTADPKGARHTDATVAACAHRMNLRFDAVPEDRNGLVFPITHIGGIAFLFGGLLGGYAHILVEVFDAQESCRLLAREGVTIAGAGPVFWMAYVDWQQQHPGERAFPALRALLGGGASKPPTIHDEVQSVLGVVLATGYGMTECPTATHASVHDADEVRRADGRALDDVDIRIVDHDGNDCAPGVEGEIRVRGPMIFQGYVDASHDADAFDDAGFHRSGDVGRVDERGVLTVTGRVKDIIIRKGENISAREIEDVLYQHPAIADAAVIALPDRARGELACAVIVAEVGHDAPTLHDVGAHCRAAGLSTRKLPERLEVVEALPRNPTGKVLKYQLQARYRDA